MAPGQRNILLLLLEIYNAITLRVDKPNHGFLTVRGSVRNLVQAGSYSGERQ